MKKKEKLKSPLTKMDNNGLISAGNSEIIDLNSGASTYLSTNYGGWPDRFYFMLSNVPSNRGGMTASGGWPDRGHWVAEDPWTGGCFDYWYNE